MSDYLLREENVDNESYEEVSYKYKWKTERKDLIIQAINAKM